MLYSLYMKPSRLFQLNDQDKNLLASLRVELLVLFGSQVLDIASQTSDYDFGVILQTGQLEVGHKLVYDELYDFLSAKINLLVNIDIVFLHSAPLELQFHVAKYGKVLYECQDQMFAKYRESVMLKYADFAPFRYIFQAATLARIP